MNSIDSMLKRINALVGTKDLSKWEEEFVESCWEKSHEATDTRRLSDKQIDKIEQIFHKHFAG